MSSRLRSILGVSNRVKKKKPSSSKTGSGGNNNSHAASPQSSSWSNSLPRKKAGTSSAPDTAETQLQDDAEETEDYRPDEPLPSGGLVHALLTDLTLRDVPQAMRYSHSHMFTPLPEQPSSYGLSSTRVAEVLNLRRNLPPLTTTMHLHALLLSPTAVERETAELMRTGTLRKTVILRRGAGNKAGGGVVEFLLESQDLETLVNESGMPQATKEAFVAWLKANPAKLNIAASDIDTGEASTSDGPKTSSNVDQLIRAGFLTTFHNLDIGHVSSSFARAEDIGTMLSLQNISRAAAGSFAAVGGSDALHSSGGSGGARSGGGGGGGCGAGGGGGAVDDLSLAVPGQGAYLKLLSAAVSHLTTGLLGKARYREMPEALLRERWDGGVAGETSRQHAGKKGRREFAGVLPGRTRKWKEFYGLAFEWVLHEAVGAGLVEVFETGSVGRGVRLL
ncbi:unnamed protein product [Discula destructiva]